MSYQKAKNKAKDKKKKKKKKEKKKKKKKKEKLAKNSRICAKDSGPNLNILPLPKYGQRLAQA